MVISFIIPGFSPFGNIDDADPDAALKAAVECLIDYDPQMLRDFVRFDAPYGSMSGDGGWTIERRDKPPKVPGAFDDWPDWADYRAYVEPGEGYNLDHPEGFYDESTFMKYLIKGLKAYVFRWPEKRAEIDKLMNDLDIGSLDEEA